MADRYTFRGKRLDNGEWVQGSLISFDNGSKSILPSATKAFVPQGQTVIASKYCCHVDPSTVGRCTGMTDKNGKLIWEGDRFLTYKGEEYEKEYTVKLEKGCFVLVGQEDWDFLQTNTGAGEVIGNIHDNPEMLGG